ncbi:MAG: ankyrin repeat domain-containing protein [Rickettsiales bacterium]|nr:ankyrin repeat domain-containing protein [Rickettsiales bacterium]
MILRLIVAITLLQLFCSSVFAAVDVESLGLDKIDNKDLPVKPSVENNNVTITTKRDVIVEKDIEKLSIKKDVKSQETTPPDNSKKVEVKETQPIVAPSNDKVSSLSDNKKDEEVKKEENKIPNNNNAESPVVGGAISKIQNFINNAKNTLAKGSKAEDKSKIKTTKNEKKQKKKLSELDKLRQKYLIKTDSKKSNNYDNTADEYFDDDNSKIVPKRREVKNFSSYEVPAPPIFDRYRTKDNLHIPPIITKEEKVAMLFDIVTNSNNTSYFKSVYDQIGDPNAKNASGDTLLTYAILLQKHSMVASILGLGANPDMPNSLGYTPLGIVIEIGDQISLKLLIENNVKVDYVDAFGRNYLMHAARTGFLQAADVLVEKGIDVNAMDNDSFTALSIAYRHKKDVMVKFLLKHGAQAWIEKPYDASSQPLIKELNDRWKN